MDNESPMTELRRLRHALKAMARSVSKSLATESYAGAGNLVVRNYQRLHQKSVELFPDDYFIETFALEDDVEGLDDRQKLTQVQFMLNQMLTYVESVLRDESPNSADMDDIRSMGGELRDQILRMTKTTIKSALSNIDFADWSPPEPPEPPEPPSPPDPSTGRRKIKINVHTDDYTNDLDFDDDAGIEVDFDSDFDDDEKRKNDDDASIPRDNIV